MAHPNRSFWREDVTKCQQEITQLRNQQFALGTVSLTLFGAYIAALTPRMLEAARPDSANLFFGASIAVLALFWIMFFWMIRLRRLITVIAVYLRKVDASQWEVDIKNFTRNCPSGQTKVISYVFLFLGFAVPIYVWAVFSLGPNSFPEGKPQYLIGFAIAYLISVLTMGILNTSHGEKAVDDQWTKVLETPELKRPAGNSQ